MNVSRIASSADEARRYFTLVGREEIAENEFNLNLPRYVDTFEPEKVLSLAEALQNVKDAERAAETATQSLYAKLATLEAVR